MKILVIPSWYPSKSYPNNGSFFKEQAEALSRNGNEVTVLCVEIPYRKTKKDFRYFVCNRYEENGITVLRYVLPLSFLHRLPKMYYAFLSLFSRVVLKKKVLKHGFNAIHAHSFLIGGFLGVRLAKYLDCPCVITEHTSKILSGTLNSAERKALRECVGKSDGFVCVSNNLKNRVKELTQSEKTLLVYPNLVNSSFSFGKKSTEDGFIITSVGNLIPLKQMDLLIRAFCRAFSVDDRVKLDIIGEGAERGRLEELIRTESRASQITLHGLLPRAQVGERLQRSNALALVSSRETFGVAYIEGLATGNVLVGTKNGGADDIITDENGILVSDFSEEMIAKALRRVYDNYSGYSPENISKKATELYGEAEFYKFYNNLFENL